MTVLQYVEGLTDRQAADAVRERIDWKYSLGLELTDPGFDFSLLSEFRLRLVAEGAEILLLDRLLEVCQQRGWLKAGGKQRTDSTHVLARVRSLSNLECVGETLRASLDVAQAAQEAGIQIKRLRNSTNYIALLSDIETDNPAGDIFLVDFQPFQHNSAQTRA